MATSPSRGDAKGSSAVFRVADVETIGASSAILRCENQQKIHLTMTVPFPRVRLFLTPIANPSTPCSRSISAPPMHYRSF